MKPTTEELYQLYHVEKLSKAKIGHRFKRTAQTAHRWLRDAGLCDEVPSDMADKLTKQWVYEQRDKRKDKTQLEPAIEQVDEEIDLQPPQAFEPPQIAESSSAFDRLSTKQQLAIKLIGSMLTDERNMSYAQIAAQIGITTETLIRWRKETTFQDALKEYSVPQFQSHALEAIQKRLLNIIKDGKERPEDRKLLAEITGLIGGDGLTVNVGIIHGPSHLTNRWK